MGSCVFMCVERVTMGVHMYVACFKYVVSATLNRTSVVKRNFLVTFRLEVTLFTKAREIYKNLPTAVSQSIYRR